MPSAALTSFHQFNSSRVIFSEPYTIYPREDKSGSYQKVYMQIDEEGSNRNSDLIINTPPHLMSFGIQERRDKNTNEVIGHQVPIILWNKKGATDEEKEFTNALQSIVHRCQDFIHDNFDSDPEKLKILSWRSQDDGQEYPVLFVKLITNRKTNRIMTLFINEETNEEIDPADLINKHCLMTAALKFENLYIGDNVSLQIKLYEVLVKFIDRKKRNVYRPTSLLRPKTRIGRKQIKSVENTAENGNNAEGADKETPPTPAKGSDNPFDALKEEESGE